MFQSPAADETAGILTNFLQTAHLYKPLDGYKMKFGIHLCTFGEIISECEGILVRLNRTSAENTAEGVPPAGSNAANGRSRDSVPPYGGTTYRFTVEVCTGQTDSVALYGWS